LSLLSLDPSDMRLSSRLYVRESPDRLFGFRADVLPHYWKLAK
jgi:hypothetical protein